MGNITSRWLFAFVPLLCVACGAADDEPPVSPGTPDAGLPDDPDAGGLPRDIDAGPDDPDGGEVLAPLGRGGAETLSGASEAGRVDGRRGVARFNNPVNVALSPEGDLYVADFDNGAVRRLSSDGGVATVVSQANFQRPFGLMFTSTGRMLVQTDINDRNGRATKNGTLWEIDRDTGRATVIVRDIGRTRGMLELPDGRIALSDYVHHTLKVLDISTGSVILLAGAEGQPGYVDGAGTAARFNEPYDMVFADGRILVADKANHVIRSVELNGAVSTFAGTGARGLVNGPRENARFNEPQALALGEDGTVYLTDSDNFSVRTISTTGEVTTVAGDGSAGHADAANPMQARFYGLEGLAADDRFLYIADGNRGDDGTFHRVRRVDLASL